MISGGWKLINSLNIRSKSRTRSLEEKRITSRNNDTIQACENLAIALELLIANSLVASWFSNQRQV